MQYKKDRSGGKFEVFKDNKYIAFVNPIANDVTVKELATNKTYIAVADTIGLVQRAKYWDFYDSNSKNKGDYKKEFKEAVIWLAKEFNLIKKIKNGEIKLNLQQINALEMEKKSCRKNC